MELNQKLLREIFDYDPTHPLALRWKKAPLRFPKLLGEIAGHWHPTSGHKPAPGREPLLARYVDIPGRSRVPLHHVVWVYHNGTKPPHCFGPSKASPRDYRIENLIRYPRRALPEQRKAKRTTYWHNWRATFTDEQWAEFSRSRNLKKFYGITADTYDQILEKQNGLCAICQQPETSLRKGRLFRLSLDHCHATGKVRALLCVNCNNGLGRFKDNAAALRRAADYVEGKL